MTRPTGRALLLLALGLPVAALPTLVGDAALWVVWLAWLAGVFVLLLAEWVQLPRRTALGVEVTAPALVYFGDREAFTVRATSTVPMRVDLRLDAGGVIGPSAALALDVRPDAVTTLEVPIDPARRGLATCTSWHARWRGPLGLLWREIRTPVDLRVRVVPNVRAVRRRALRYVANRSFQTGLRVERFLGDGSEFEALREFVAGMDRRSIDWKATARHRALLSREFRAERDHQVMVCIDTGRLMSEPLDGMPRLDHAIHAALQLGYVCLRTGDRVGLFTFADRGGHRILPQAGVHALHAIQDKLAEVDYSTAETNYTLAMTELLQQLRRRTLVVLFTDFVDSITAELMVPNVQWLARRHLLVFVTMRDPLPETLAQREPQGVEDIHRAVVAADIRRERSLVLERIRRCGAQVVDASVDDLGPDLIDRYLQIKRRELL